MGKLIIIGLTGSIGMGKSTTAAMFKRAGAAVFDADAAVHELYAKGGKAVPLLRAVFDDVVVDGAVYRPALAKHLNGDPLLFKVLESFIHPWVGEMRAAAIEQAKSDGKRVIVFDVPLLFETGGEARVDYSVVVSANKAEQKNRVLARNGMSAEKFKMILGRQMPDAEKCAKADFVIKTDQGLEYARARVDEIMDEVLRRSGV